MTEQAAALQSRLSKVFGGLTRPGEEQLAAWQPATVQVFRVGAPLGDQEGGSSDEEAEFEERARREVVPGLALDLATEDEPDAEGFRPSSAFCRALDREEEYSAADEVAMGTYRGRAAEVLPPRSMEVLEDNIWEQRIAQREALRHAGELEAPQPAAPTAMETDGGGALGARRQQQEEQQLALAAEGAGRRGSSQGGEGVAGPRPALVSNGSPRTKQQPKRVRFQGVPEPWVPPHRREGFVARDLQGPPPPQPGDPAEAPARRFAVIPPRRTEGGPSLSNVAYHIQHPEKYTLYTLDEPLLVGGGLRQLGAEGKDELEQAAAVGAARDVRGAGEGLAAAAWEPERWQGAVGAGIEFRPKAQRSVAEGPKLAPENGSARGAGGWAAMQGAVRLSMVQEEEEGEAQELGRSGGQQDGGGVGVCPADSRGGDSEMADADAAARQRQQEATPGAQFKARARSGRGYRSKGAAEAEGEG